MKNRSWPYAPPRWDEHGLRPIDIFWLKDESQEDSAELSDPDLIAAEIVEDLRAALEEFETIQADLRGDQAGTIEVVTDDLAGATR